MIALVYKIRKELTMKYVKYGIAILFTFTGITMLFDPIYTVSEGLFGVGIGILLFFVPMHWYRIAWEKTKEWSAKLFNNSKKNDNELSMTLKDGFFKKTVRKDQDGYYYLSDTPTASAERYTFEHIEYAGSTKYQHTGKKRMGVKNRAKKFANPSVRYSPSRQKRALYDNDGTTRITEETEGKGRLYLRSVDTNGLETISFKTNDAGFDNIKRFFNVK